MIRYLEVAAVRSDLVNEYLDEGWRIIETTKELIDHQTTTITYHVGYPVELHLQKLKKIIEDYEHHGFKEKLFEEIAKKNNENLDDYSSRSGVHTDNKTPTYMTEYYKVVHNKYKSFYKKSSDDTDEYIF